MMVPEEPPRRPTSHPMDHLITSNVATYGYLAIFVLMTLESACLPIPSEVVMLFGGALASGTTIAGVHGDLNVVAVALVGVAGNVVGSLIAYAVGRSGGRPLLERWGRWVLVRPHHLERADAFFARWGEHAVFFGRMLPVVRTFISLPAGVARLAPVRFTLLTAAGSAPWTFGLALAGLALAAHWHSVAGAFTPVSIAVGVLLVGAATWWVVRQLRHRSAAAGLPPAPDARSRELDPTGRS